MEHCIKKFILVLAALFATTLPLLAGKETPEAHLMRVKNVMRGTFLEHGWVITSKNPNQQEFTHPFGATSAFLVGLAQEGGRDSLQHVQITFQSEESGSIKPYLAVKPPIRKADLAEVNSLIKGLNMLCMKVQKMGMSYKPK